jgi:hypothetical protein
MPRFENKTGAPKAYWCVVGSFHALDRLIPFLQVLVSVEQHNQRAGTVASFIGLHSLTTIQIFIEWKGDDSSDEHHVHGGWNLANMKSPPPHTSCSSHKLPFNPQQGVDRGSGCLLSLIDILDQITPPTRSTGHGTRSLGP